MAGGYLGILVTYLIWRVTETVLPARDLSVGSAIVWVIFLAEAWLWYETLQLNLLLLKRTNRSPEADAHEARLRSTPPGDLPTVDVFITTYNEPIDVLEKTIAGALALDWPKDRLFIHVLDDGRRDWLASYCSAREVNHITRADNSHAKAGNINAAVHRTGAEFILILDADFVPQRQMLMRAVGFFQDPKIGIVQMPHHFFNNTPLQTNMDMRHALPDEQRFFFDVIQPGRDGWDCAFCCGSNGIIRRSALMEIGGAMPTDSITEDMLLTLALLRKGYITRYLGERLAIGLAPETLDAYFVQRARWAQGGVQLLYVPNGPFGPGLTPLQRLFFNPSHWLSQSFCQPIAMATPAFFLLTGLPPLLNASLAEIFAFQIPAVMAAMIFMQFLAPREFSPIASTVEAVLQSFRLLPVVVLTLIKPKGHSFKVTPKGSDVGLAREDRFTIRIALSILFATGLGLLINADYSIRIVETGDLLPVVAFWSVFNMVILLIVITAAIPRPVFRTEERFAISEPCRVSTDSSETTGETIDMSLTGVLAALHRPDELPDVQPGKWLGTEIIGVGVVPTLVRRVFRVGDETRIGMSFHLPDGPVRDRFIQKLFCEGRQTASAKIDTRGSFLLMLTRIFGKPRTLPRHAAPGPSPMPPDWLIQKLGHSSTKQNARAIRPGPSARKTNTV